MDKKLVLDIKVEMNGQAVQLKNAHAEVLMIPFAGTATGEIFNGIVEPCGVDTQTVNAARVRHMSARYMLTGKDSAGNDCHVYVANDGWFDDAHPQSPFRTVPTFITDSPVLAPYLHCNRFVGEGSDGPDGLHIRFYEA